MMADDKSEEAQAESPDEDEEPGYYEPWDKNARPGLGVPRTRNRAKERRHVEKVLDIT